ncbi:hypothetical protein M231_00366 [Tremella mesenterica]|uniref:Solute carrier family 45, member 1/2/4 n=1 Tax=Tremella mesenterica TaxID=5217 RepID=A0A4Q1BWD8_TREME|nr:hypothetical protein M231_00366 [Tremella mesenterica]
MTGGAFIPTADEFDDSGSHEVQWVGKPSIKGPRWAKVPFLTIGMLGIQCVWSIEMGYASPYLLELGLSKSWMSLVFMAGPLSGLVVQPLIGVLADRSKSRFGRRRPFMLAGITICAIAMMLLGWTREVSSFFGFGSWMAVTLAVFAIYLIDFSINAVMSTDRALVVDTLPNNRQDEGSAWAGRMFGFGSLAGFFVGNLDLPPVLPFLGKTQLQILSFITSAILLTCHSLTSWAVTERVLLRSRPNAKNGLFASLKAIWDNIFSLPPGIRMVCIIDLFASLGWFPILFFTTVWVSEIYKRSMPQGDLSDEVFEGRAVRSGARALFFQAIINILISVCLPPFVAESGIVLDDVAGYSPLNGGGNPDRPPNSASRKRMREIDDGSSFIQRSLDRGKNLIASLKDGSAWALPIPGLTLISIWWISQFIFAGCMAATLFVETVTGAYIIIGITGITWGVFQWAPFSLLGELILIDGQIDRDQPDVLFMRTSAESEAHLLRPHRTHSRSSPPLPVYSVDLSGPSTSASTSASSPHPESSPIHTRHHSRSSLTLNHQHHESSPTRKSTDTMPENGTTQNLTPLVIQTPQMEDHSSTVIVRHSSDTSSKSSFEGDGADPGNSSFSARSNSSERKGMADKAGVILGIHNVFLVMPQFLVTILSSAIFYLMEPDKSLPSHHPHANPVVNGTVAAVEAPTGVVELGERLMRREGVMQAGSSDAVGLIFRIGGVSAAVGAFLTWRLARRWARGKGI